MTPDARRRVLAASAALATYAAGCATPPAEPQHTAFSDGPKHNVPRSIEKPDDYTIRLPRPRASRQAAAPRPREVRGDATCTLDDIRRRESGGDYGAVNPTGKYRGAYQFDARTWRGAVTRAGHPDYADTPPDQAPPGVQDAAAAQLYAERGTQPWSVCR